MRNNGILAIDETIGNVMKCACNIVHVNAPGVSLRFQRDAFLHFASMVHEAREFLMEQELSAIMNNTLEYDDE